MKAALGFFPFLLGSLIGHAEPGSQQAWSRFQSQAANALESAQRQRAALPPLAEGVSELRFQDFFKPVVGDRGLEYSEKLLKLDGRRVRIAGFMVREQLRADGVFMLTPWPSRVENDGFCLNEDFPPATLHVLVPGSTAPVPYRPGLVVLTGVLTVKPAAMPDGRNCVAALTLEGELPTTASAPSTK
jgi:hypothetical protein